MGQGERFKFRLERVRAVREHAEREAREELAESIRQRLRGEALLAQARQLVASARASRATAGSGTYAAASELVALQAWLERVEFAAAEAQGELERARRAEEQRKARAIRALQERKALDRLRERRLEQHLRTLRRREALLLDELARRRGGEAA